MKNIILEEIEEYDISSFNDFVEHSLDDEVSGSLYKKIGITVGVLAVTSVIATPVITFIGYKSGALLYAVGTSVSFFGLFS